MELKVIVEDGVKIPSYAKNGDSGFDLFCKEDIVLKAKSYSNLIKTGIRVELPKNCELQIRPKSGVSLNTTLRVVLGTVDNGYRGEIGIIVDNIGDKDIVINKGKAIAQGVVVHLPNINISLVDSISNSDRGDGGFGSTGRGI